MCEYSKFQGHEGKYKNSHRLSEYVTSVTIYINILIGRQKIEKKFKENKNRSLLDCVTVSDESFAILVHKNNKEI